MLGATVVVLANLKAKPLRGFTSHGMVMCAEGPTTQLLEVPAGAQVRAAQLPAAEAATFRAVADGQGCRQVAGCRTKS